jgi:hypothetical protein
VLGHARDERRRFGLFGLGTKVVAVKTLAAALPGSSLGQRSSARGTGQVMHLVLRNFDRSANARSAGLVPAQPRSRRDMAVRNGFAAAGRGPLTGARVGYRTDPGGVTLKYS